jgi:hypothetical protein
MESLIKAYLQKVAALPPDRGPLQKVHTPEQQEAWRKSLPGFHKGYTTHIPQVSATYDAKPGAFFQRDPYIKSFLDARTQHRRRYRGKSPADILRNIQRDPEMYTPEGFQKRLQRYQDLQTEANKLKAGVPTALGQMVERQPYMFDSEAYKHLMSTMPEGVSDIQKHPLFTPANQYARAISKQRSELRRLGRIQTAQQYLQNPPEYLKKYKSSLQAPTPPGRYTAEDQARFNKAMGGGLTNTSEFASAGPHFNRDTREIYMPPAGENLANWPVLWHEFTHKQDPVIQAEGEAWKGQGVMGSGRPMARTATPLEIEIPAMVVENQAARSPYMPKADRKPVGPGMLDRQVAQHGPVLTGNIRRDQPRVRNWTRAIRSMPDAQIPAPKPFAYHGDRRTPQQRAQALGKGYQGWMNYHAGQVKPPAPPKPTGPLRFGE